MVVWTGRQKRARASTRVVGVDIARGVALLGMTIIHTPVIPEANRPLGPWTAGLLSAPAGISSVLFFLLSGVSLTLVARSGSASATDDVLRRRGVVLLVAGFALSWGPWPVSILEHYGVMFLLAPWLLRRSDRSLTSVAGAGLLLGPVVLLAARHLTDEWASIGKAGWSVWILNGSWSLLVSGNFPLLVWVGFFAAGARLGRLDLGARRVGQRLLVAGLLTVAVVRVGVAGAGALGVAHTPLEADPTGITGIERPGLVVRDQPIDDDPRQLLDTRPHSGQLAWTLATAGLATTILGAALSLPATTHRWLRPLARLGTVSLSAYLAHIFLVADLWWHVGGLPGVASVRRQLVVMVGFCLAMLVFGDRVVAWRGRGPAERLIAFLCGPRRVPDHRAG